MFCHTCVIMRLFRTMCRALTIIRLPRKLIHEGWLLVDAERNDRRYHLYRYHNQPCAHDRKSMKSAMRISGTIGLFTLHSNPWPEVRVQQHISMVLIQCQFTFPVCHVVATPGMPCRYMAG